MKKVLLIAALVTIIAGCGSQSEKENDSATAAQTSATASSTVSASPSAEAAPSTSASTANVIVKQSPIGKDWVRDENHNAKGVTAGINEVRFTQDGNVLMDVHVENKTDRKIFVDNMNFSLMTVDNTLLNAELDPETNGQQNMTLISDGKVDSYLVAFKVAPDKIKALALVDELAEPIVFMFPDANTKINIGNSDGQSEDPNASFDPNAAVKADDFTENSNP